MSKKCVCHFSVFIIGLLLLGMVSGCASEIEKSIVGKWYNKNNKCLDIRDDGTYKLEDSYGTGKWKLLDDKETYEFLDYYGDSQETRIYNDDLGQYLEFGYYGDFYKDSFPSKNGQNSEGNNEGNTEKVESEIDIEFIRAVSAGTGFYKVEFRIGDKKYCGIANANGQIIHYTDQYSIYQSLGGQDVWKGLDFTPMSDYSGCVCESYERSPTYFVINSQGNKKTFTNEDFDVILGGGGGYLLVYKNTGNISKAEDSYGLIDSNGEWVIALTPGNKILHDGEYKYLGEKVFAYSFYRGEDQVIVFDCANNATIGFYGCVLLSGSDSNGKFIIDPRIVYGAEYSVPYGSDNKKTLNHDKSYKFCADGTYQEIPLIKASSGRIAIYEESGFYQIWNTETNQVTTFDAVPASSITQCSCVDDYTFLLIRGEDRNFYYTIFDSQGAQLFEPKSCANMSNITFCGDRVIYQAQSGYYEMIDIDGNLIISDSLKCSSLQIEGNAVIGKVDRNMVYFDKDGNEIVFRRKSQSE